jgi:malate synthase
VEEIETKVEIKVEMADDDKAYIDFLMQKTKDDAFAAAERIGNYGGYAKAALTKIDAAQTGINDTQRKLEAGEITPEQAVELMREYRQELIDGNAELLEIRNNVQDELTGIFEAFHEEIENGIEKLEHYGAVLNGYKNIIDIVGKGMLGLSDETMNTLNKAIVSNANDTIRAVKAQKDANDKTIAEMK